MVGKCSRVRRISLMALFAGLWAALLPGAKAELPATTSCRVSPDGKLLAFDARKPHVTGGQITCIMVSDIDGSNLREAKEIAGSCTDLAWLGNDRLVYAIVESDERSQDRAPHGMSQGVSPAWPGAGTVLKVISLDGSDVREIRLPAGCDVLYKVLSPDVQYAAFVGNYTPAGKEPEYGLFAVKLDGGPVRRLLDEAVKTSPAWSPDSKQLAIGKAAGYVGRYPLVVIDVEAGTITPTDVNGVGAAWSPDGRRLACSTEVVAGGSWMRGVPIDSSVGVFDIQTKTMKLLTPSGHNNRGTRPWQVGGSFNPVWSPDSRSIAYWRTAAMPGSEAGEINETWVVNCEGTEFRKISDAWQTVAWSSDSKWLIWIEDGKPQRVELASLPAVDAAAEYAKRPILAPEAMAAAAQPSWSTAQATGKPNTPRAGDRPTAWASATPDAQPEWLTLTYAQPVKVKEVQVVETFNPGALIRVTVFDAEGNEVEAWKGEDPTPQGSGMGTSKIPINVAFPVSKVKLFIDSPRVPGWNEIDAVGLLDETGEAHWAESAQASSTFAERMPREGDEGYGQISPPAVEIPANAVRLSYVADLDKRSLGGSGHAIAFERPTASKQVMAVSIYASRYGLPQPPQEDFHIYLLDQDQKVIKDVPVPYAMIARGEMRWYTFAVPPTEVPSPFFVALSFNPHQTKGIYLGLDRNVKESHSYVGLPASGFAKVDETYDWMVRVYVTPESAGGQK